MSDASFSTTIINEHGKTVHIKVKQEAETGDVTIFGEGDESTCEHTWTRAEAEEIYKGLGVVLNKYMDHSSCWRISSSSVPHDSTSSSSREYNSCSIEDRTLFTATTRLHNRSFETLIPIGM